MRALALLLLLGNLGFFAWQQHMLPWLPWQPEQFQATETATAVPAGDTLLPPLVLLNEQPTLVHAKPTNTAPSSATATTARDVAEIPPNIVASTETALPEETQHNTPTETASKNTQLAAIETKAESPNMLDNVLNRIAERASTTKVAAEIPATASEPTPTASSPVSASQPSKPEPVVTSVAKSEAETPRVSSKPTAETATRLNMASTADKGTALTATSPAHPAKTAQAETSTPPIPLKDLVTASKPKAEPAETPVNEANTDTAKTKPPTKTNTQTAAAPTKTPVKTANTSTINTPKIPLVTQTTGIVCYRLGPYAHANSVYTGVNWFNQILRGSASLNQDRNTVPSTTWVYLPPYSNENAALQAQRELQQQGISDHYVVQNGAFQHAISLGVYRDPLSVQRRLQQLASKGYQNVRTQARGDTDNNGTSYWLNVKLPASHRALVAQFSRTHPTPKIQVVTCR